ncbi:TetR/AcrR family transcriptional regulator [soil metagenome]
MAPTRRRTASDDVSAALLGAAETVLDRDGTDGVTVRAVAKEAAVAPMGVYNRFHNKDGLLAALATRALDELVFEINAAIDADIEPVQRFRQACRGYRTFALNHPARYSLIFAAGSPLSDQSSAVAAHGRPVFGVLVGLVAALRVTRDPTETAQSVWSAIHGAVSIEIAGIGQTPDAAASFENLLDLLVEGVTAR